LLGIIEIRISYRSNEDIMIGLNKEINDMEVKDLKIKDLIIKPDVSWIFEEIKENINDNGFTPICPIWTSSLIEKPTVDGLPIDKTVLGGCPVCHHFFPNFEDNNSSNKCPCFVYKKDELILFIEAVIEQSREVSD